MFVSLAVALWGFWRGWRPHGLAGPLTLAAIGAVSLATGVVIVNGFPARQMISASAAALVAATVWNVRARAVCARPSPRVVRA